MTLVAQFSSVEEFHGPYGTYHVSELVLQRVWLKCAFDASALLDCAGRSIVIDSPGSWNRLEGPDFKGASLIVDGVRVVGDVEIHFSQSDWRNHGHGGDARYNNVVLHVVYHPLREGESSAITEDGRAIQCVSLMERLWYSLEEYASEDSIVALAGVGLKAEVETLIALPIESRREGLVGAARRRWEQKRRFAALRIDRLGWTGACHQTAMEVMGYARNRIPMLVLAERYSLEIMTSGKRVEADSLWLEVEGKWRLNGCRPANHPKLRLQQYLNWVRSCPDWPEKLQVLLSEVSRSCSNIVELGDYGAMAVRQQLGVASLEKRICEQVICGEIAGSKASTLVCDGFFPLYSALSGVDCFDLWFHWFAGNCPESCIDSLKQAEVLEPRKTPMSNGWLQGILQLGITN